jgi:two-component system KDP operon response regulator KdpE
VTLTILVADDDDAIARMVAYGVRMMWPDCRVILASDGADALRLFTRERPDLVVLDVEMPGPDGFAVCRRIRAVSQAPIMMLTVRASTSDKVRALDLGADDYLTKPFDHFELLARLRALARRGAVMGGGASEGATSPPDAASFTVGNLSLNGVTHEVRVRGGDTVRLTTTEYRLLEELARHAGRPLPYRYLLERVWGPRYVDDVHYLRVYVRRLRRKLGDDAAQPCYIQTEWGAGYRLVASS